jgi:ribA/ribD-fused uncharacterized protein
MNKQIASPIKFYHNTGEWGFLSSMHLCKIRVDGVEYKSSEHYYQSKKTTNEGKRAWIMNAETGYEAKSRAHTLKDADIVSLSPEQKVAILRKATIEKFAQNRELAIQLLATGETEIVEDAPEDTFWGVKGENWAGKVVMDARTELKKHKN